MSVTNAISGIIVVGALLQVGQSPGHHGHRRGRGAAGLHQRRRWLRGDPPHARHVLAELTVMGIVSASVAAYLVAALLFVLALAGLSRHESARRGNGFGIAGMAVALVATVLLAVDGGIDTLGAVLVVVAVVLGGAIGLRLLLPGADDRDARADRAAAQLRRPGRGAGGAGTATCTWRRTRVARPPPVSTRPACWACLRRGGHRGLRRRGHRDRVGGGEPEAVGADRLGAAGAAGQEPAQPRRAGRLRRTHRVVRRRALAGAAGGGHSPGVGAGVAPGGLDRRRGHAGGRLDAQQLLGLGRGGVGVPAGQQPADHRGRAGGVLGCLPVLRDVHRDEPVVPVGHRRRVRHRGPAVR